MSSGRAITGIDLLGSCCPCDTGFTRVYRATLRNRYDDGSLSREYEVDVVERRGIDAVGVIPWRRDALGRIEVLLRRQFRVALSWRDELRPNYLWEIVAGITDNGRDSENDLRRQASLEMLEESGYRVSDGELVRLDPPLHSSPGLLTERLHLYAVDLSGREPVPGALAGDGSPMEDSGEVVWRLLDDAYSACRDNGPSDAKTELALHRLERMLATDFSNGEWR